MSGSAMRHLLHPTNVYDHLNTSSTSTRTASNGTLKQEVGVAATSGGAIRARQTAAASPTRSLSETVVANDSKPELHKRVYQACSNCRERKVKCDLGSVDNPSDPPCQRCRRESKQCFFSATRRKRKSDASASNDRGDGYEEVDEAYLRRNRRKLLGTAFPASEHPPLPPPLSTARLGFPDSHAHPVEPPRTPNGSLAQPFPLRKPMAHGDVGPGDASENRVSNTHAQKVMSRPVYGPHDALEMLFNAALHDDTDKDDKAHSVQLPPIRDVDGSVPQQVPNPHGLKPEVHISEPPRPKASRTSQIDPALSQGKAEVDPREANPGYQDAIKAWARFKFVRAGWFTPREAIDYIEYYYKYLSPLTPISPPTFRDPATHIIMLNEEPILTMTLLMIASRYHTKPDSQSRSSAIHEQMWSYLRGMVERCMWGQEAFGNGFYNAGGLRHGVLDNDTSTTAPERGMRKGSLRTLGTVESLMMLTEWQPRGLVFPPADVTDELMLPSYDQHRARNPGTEGPQSPRDKETWLEPAWRSGRMSWMLLTTAMGLSYELGVFDDLDEAALADDISRPEYKDEDYRTRAARIKKLLLIYLTQLSGRLAWTNMVPENLRSGAFNPPRRRRQSVDGRTPDTATTASAPFTYVPNLDHDDAVIHCWAGISNAMRIGNERLYRSRAYTDKIIQDGTYVKHLKEFQPMLKHWKTEFDRYQMPTHIRHILQIEYEYVRMYLNSLSLQSVVSRCSAKAANNARLSKSGTDDHLLMSPNTQQRFDSVPLTTLGGPSPEDALYIQEVIEAGRSLLRTVVEGLRPNDYLKHVPIRIYMHIVSGAMMLFKTFALGVLESEIKISFDLVDATVDALRCCVVDDAHLSCRIAANLMSTVARLRGNFKKASVIQQPSDVSKQNSTRASPEVRRAHLDVRDAITEWNSKTPYFASPGSAGSDASQPNTPTHPQYMHTPFSAPLTPGGSAAVFADQTLGGVGSGTGGPNQVTTEPFYFLTPGAQFFQNASDQPITHTTEGVQIGGYDLLDMFLGGDEGYPGPSGLF